MNQPQTLDLSARMYLAEWMTKHAIKSVLEVGTGYGLTSIAWAKAIPNVQIVTLEKHHVHAQRARENIRKAQLGHMIELIEIDAQDYQPTQSFDMIFLDGPKAQLLAQFNHFIPYLKPQGSVWIDNLDFHGHRNQVIQGRPNLSALMRKLEQFITVIEDHPDYLTQHIAIGDGLMRVWHKYPDLKL